MDREAKHLRKAARYPLFLVGLVILVPGLLYAKSANLSPDVEATIGIVGFIFLVLSVAIR
jgi:hypothetical protein